MTRNTKLSLVVVAVVAAVVGILLVVNGTGRQAPSTEVASSAGSLPLEAQSLLVRPDSHRLTSAADGKVTVVEFLDLECEACGAAFPGVEQLRAEYGDRVTFVMRYFPIRSHRNAELAARAVEAAGRQGKLEPMYQLMYVNQPQWGDQQVSHRDTFLGFARQLGLEMARFESDLDSPEVADRVRRDQADGTALGVRGTPTFFINGSVFQGRPTYQGLKAAIDQELAR